MDERIICYEKNDWQTADRHRVDCCGGGSLAGNYPRENKLYDEAGAGQGRA